MSFVQKTEWRNHLIETDVFLLLIEVRENFTQSSKAAVYPTHPHLSATHVCLTSLELHTISRMAGRNAF